MNQTNGAIASIERQKKSEEAILLVTFGSTHTGPHRTFASLRDAFVRAFPQSDLFMSFTSKICMKRWAEKSGEVYHAPDVWLEALGRAGYKRIVVQSLHVIPGLEYSLLTERYIPDFLKEFPDVTVCLGHPLLWSDADRDAVGDALLDIFGECLDRGEALVLMGHGNHTAAYPEANERYCSLNRYLQARNPGIVIGTVDYKSMLFDYVSDYLDEHLEPGAVINLAPLMSVAGDHAQNDLAGVAKPDEADEEQSWMVRLLRKGYRIDREDNCHLLGLADYEPIRQIWIEHMRKAEKVNL